MSMDLDAGEDPELVSEVSVKCSSRRPRRRWCLRVLPARAACMRRPRPPRMYPTGWLRHIARSYEAARAFLSSHFGEGVAPS